jgi:hypothetical protein
MPFPAEITFPEEIPNREPRTPFFNEKRRLLFVYFPIFLLVTLPFALVLDENSGATRILDVVVTIGINIAAFAWCRVDSRQRGYELHKLFPFAIIVFGALALLYYLFRSRGFLRGLISIAWLLLYAVVCFGVVFIVVMIVVFALALGGILPPEILEV